MDLRYWTFILSTLHINFFPSNSLLKKKENPKQTRNVIWNLAPKELNFLKACSVFTSAVLHFTSFLDTIPFAFYQNTPPSQPFFLDPETILFPVHQLTKQRSKNTKYYIIFLTLKALSIIVADDMIFLLADDSLEMSLCQVLFTLKNTKKLNQNVIPWSCAYSIIRVKTS